jgi:Domain of unknown function (DUF4082)/PEP-CTERM motif
MIDALGYYDPSGLTESHDVGLYDTSGDLLVSATVTNANTVTDNFAYSSISPFSLSAGTYFLVGVSGLTDLYGYAPTMLTPAAGVTFVQSEYADGNTLAFPTTTDVNIGYFGPNLDFGSSVPEPGTAMMLGISLAAIATLLRRRRS